MFTKGSACGMMEGIKNSIMCIQSGWSQGFIDLDSGDGDSGGANLRSNSGKVKE